MKRTAIVLGVTGALMSLTIAAPAQAATPPAPVITTEAASRYVAAPPVVAVDGPTQVGYAIEANDGTWQWPTAWLTPGTTRTYQWLRDGVAVPGETRQYYPLREADIGKKISYRVTGSAPGYKPVTRTSNSTVPIWDKTDAPVLSYLSPTPGSVVTGHQFSWWRTATPMTLKYQWLRNGAPIDGATTQSYRLTTADLGTSITLRVRGISGTKTLRTVYSAPMKPSKLTKLLTPVSTPMTGLRSDPQVGQRVSVIPPKWQQAGVKTSIQWLRDGTAIPGATSAIYTPVTADQGKQLTFTVTGRLTGYADTVIAAGSWLHKVMPAFPAEAAPTITGTATVGSELIARNGTHRMPTQVWFQWQRNGKDIPGAERVVYKLTSADRGAKITVRAIQGYRPAPGDVEGPSLTSAAVTVR